MDGAERRSRILTTLEGRERVGVADLAVELNASEVTIRKDLDDLAAAGALRRVRGGAVSAARRGLTAPFVVREREAYPEKERIARAAAELIGDGEAVLLDSGTTGLQTAIALADHAITLMPLSAREIAALVDAPGVALVLPGGPVRPVELAFNGAVAERGVAMMRFDTFLLTPCAITAEHGVTAYDVDDATIKRTGIDAANRVIALAEGRKLARTAMAAVCEPGEIDILITDRDAPVAATDALVELGIEVVRV
ncbi:DeoR/GlpR family DNA-binding transcription regulator [Microlunatus soli]|uniref:Lactose phosphotransferase system repressor n=1 Tax=Microlunatus soli TaxID=630515 RepID=A0A1H1WLC1_9ACTN|nr:DeoR/GlpR family DNA-binding transcription regulator [Microlunatus soli]SDS97480.1 DNA-binding transcriptional regulator of sugar metabolism, DeoR/GlpR family [Microlunatus soli]